MRSVFVRQTGFWVALACILAASTAARAQEPRQTTVCQIKSDPAAYDRKLVQVTAFASHGFENFTFFDPECQAWPEIWLEYGGTTTSGTVYCCDAPKSRKRSKPAEMAGFTIPLVDDKPFRDFDRLIQRPADSIARATLVGRFFAAGHATSEHSGPGYGHMACCSLLMIQQVVAVDPQTRGDLDYRTAPDQPTASRSGCGVRIVLEATSIGKIAAQRQAEAGPRAWSFDDPARVASDALIGLLKLDPATAITMTQARKSPGRISYEWKPPGKKESYTVVVNRPYWLSFEAKDPLKVAWVVMAAYEFSCE
jgi:hypothetical protein